MPQYGRPSADTYNADGYTDQAGGAVNIYLTIDEVTLDDADYVRSALAPTSDVYVTKYTNLEDPQSSSGHIFRVRYRKDSAAGSQIDIIAQLRQGYVNEAGQGTLIVGRTYTNVSETPTTDAYTLAAGEADAITDYNSLFLRVVSNQV